MVVMGIMGIMWRNNLPISYNPNRNPLQLLGMFLAY